MAIDRQIITTSSGNLSLDDNSKFLDIYGAGRGGDRPVNPRTPDTDGRSRGDLVSDSTDDTPVNPAYDETLDSDKRDNDRDVPPVNGGSSGVTPFVPDASLSPQENLDNITKWITALFSTSHFAGDIFNSTSYANLLTDAYNAVWRLSSTVGLDSEARLTLAEKVSDLSWNLITMQFQQALSYQSWYLQQEYNSPINQVNRLAQAGLSSAFAVSGYTTGNAQQSAGVSSPEPTLPSGAGQVQQQRNQSDLSFLGTLLSAASSFLPSAAGAVGSLVTAFATKQLTAKQIQLADSEIINNAATFEKLRSEKDSIENNVLLRNFDTIYKSSQEAVSQSAQNVQLQKSRYDSALERYMQDVEMQGYRVNVVTKSGHKETRDLTVSEVQDAFANDWKLKDGSSIAHEGSVSAGLSVSQSLGLPGVGEAKVAGSLSGSSTDKSGVSKESSKGGSDTHSDKVTTQGYSSDGRSFTVGDTKFESITIRKKLPIPEHKQYIDSCLKAYEKSLDEFNTLSTGEKARLLDLLDNVERNLSSFNGRMIHKIYIDKINNLLTTPIQSVD